MYGGGSSQTGKTDLYSFLPPGWDTGAPVETLRTRNSEPTHVEEVSDSEEYTLPSVPTVTNPPEEYGGHSNTLESAELHDHHEEPSSTDPSLREITIESDKEPELSSEEKQEKPKEEKKKEDKGKGKATVDREDTTESVSISDEHEQKIFITVGEYQKHGEGMGAYIAYKLHVKTSLAQYHKQEFTVERRYNDFYWLHDNLKEHFKGYIVPPMPDKTIIQNRFDTQFIEMRRRELGKFLKRIAEHSALSTSETFQTFLEADPEELVMAKSKKPQTGVTKKVFSWVSSTVSHPSPVEIDNWFEGKRTYLNDLEAKIDALLKASNLVVAREKDVVAALYDMSLKALATASVEEPVSGKLARHVTKFGDVLDHVRCLQQESISNQEVRLDETLADYLRIIVAAKDAVNARLACLAAYQAADKNSLAKKERKEKMAGTPKAGVADSEFEEAEKRLEAAKEEYELVSGRVRAELNRFEQTKAREIQIAILDFAKANMDATVQVADQWKKLINHLQTTDE